MKSVVLLVFGACVVGLSDGLARTCGYSFTAPNPKNDRIVHGVVAPEGAWPWLVSLSWNNTDGAPGEFVHTCGATIVRPQWLVTAGHCFDGYGKDFKPAHRASDWKAEAGEHVVKTKSDDNINHHSTSHDISMIVPHEEYIDPFSPHDIAMIKLKQPIQMTPRIQEICIPDEDEEFDELETNCYAAGWGQTFGTAEKPDHLQQIHSEIFNLEACKEVHGDDGAVHDKSVCFGDGRKGTCMGDSGGPLMCKRGSVWKLVGVTSWGNSFCIEQPAVFTKVAAHRQWIHDQIAQYS